MRAVVAGDNFTMISPPIVRRIKSLRDLGVFRNYSAGADVPPFERLNLIYGFNGSGKTTLSRVFRSLNVGSLQPGLPPGGHFEVELTNGDAIKSDSAPGTLKGRVFVFSVDFIEENLRWKDGTANPVFYLGKAQAELAQKLEEAETNFSRLSQDLSDANQTLRTKDAAFTQRVYNRGPPARLGYQAQPQVTGGWGAC